MPAPAIARYEDRNYVGLCHLDVVEVDDVVSVPAEVSGNVLDAVVLAEGASWSRVYLNDDGGLFVERWALRDGDQYAEAVISGTVARDRLALMPHLWGMKGRRYLVVFTTRNGDQLLMGRKETPAMALVRERRTGDAEQMERDRNQYEVVFSLTRRLPVPFYQGTVPEPTPDNCPGLNVLVPAATWETIQGYLTSGQLEAAEAAICRTLCQLLDEGIILGGEPEFTGISATLNGVSGSIPATGTTNGKPSGSTNTWNGGDYAEFLWNGGAWLVSDGFSTWTSTEDVPTPGEVTTWSGPAPLPTVSDETSGGDDVSAVTDCLSPEQAAALAAALGASGGGEVQIRNGNDSATLATLTAPDSYVIPGIRIPYIDADGAEQYFMVVVAGITGGELTVTQPGGGPPPVPRFRVYATDGTTPVAAKDITDPSVILPQSVIKYRDADNDAQVTAASDTEFASATLRPADEVPRRQMTDGDGDPLGVYATLDALINDTLPSTPYARVRSAVITPLFDMNFGHATPFTLDPVRITRGDGSTQDVEYRPATTSSVFTEQNHIYMDFRAGDAISAEFTVTSDFAGTYATLTNDGGSGTITWQRWNGSSWASLGSSFTLAAADLIRVTRTTSTNAGWANARTN